MSGLRLAWAGASSCEALQNVGSEKSVGVMGAVYILEKILLAAVFVGGQEWKVGSGLGSGRGGGKHWSSAGYIFQVEPSRLAGGGWRLQPSGLVNSRRVEGKVRRKLFGWDVGKMWMLWESFIQGPIVLVDSQWPGELQGC